MHGGLALTLIDSATGCAVQSVLPAGAGYTTLETKANFEAGIVRRTAETRLFHVGLTATAQATAACSRTARVRC